MQRIILTLCLLVNWTKESQNGLEDGIHCISCLQFSKIKYDINPVPTSQKIMAQIKNFRQIAQTESKIQY